MRSEGEGYSRNTGISKQGSSGYNFDTTTPEIKNIKERKNSGSKG